jgi:hypothetical protein
MSSYKGFTLNDADAPPPWGATELQAWEDVIDTLVNDLSSQQIDTTGHKHYRLYAYSGSPAIALEAAAGNVTVQGGVELWFGTDDCRIYSDSGNGVNIAAEAGQINATASGDINLSTGADINLRTTGAPGSDIAVQTDYGNISITAGSGGNVTIQAGGDLIINQLPTSSAGLTSGMIWNSSGTLKII